MNESYYIEKTRTIVNFLSHTLSENMEMVAMIQVAQAEQDTDRLIELLGLIKGRVEDWIEELKTMK